jgi:hypothetical protein
LVVGEDVDVSAEVDVVAEVWVVVGVFVGVSVGDCVLVSLGVGVPVVVSVGVSVGVVVGVSVLEASILFLNLRFCFAYCARFAVLALELRMHSASVGSTFCRKTR